MGVLNVTPDSFSDGGRYAGVKAAVAHGLELRQDGADVIDVGGESTRPGSSGVGIDEEIARVVPVIEGIRRESDVAVSVDTRKCAVAEAALAAGADILNDVSALRFDPDLRALAARRGLPVILMHMRGEPATMQSLAQYDDVVADVARELLAFREEAVAAGVDPSQIVLDPGIGFAKTFEHNLELLARAEELPGPLLIGASRKAFIGHLTGRATSERTAGSLAAVAAAFRARAALVRVHDVRETVDFLKVLAAIEERRA
jgi:dihydropteroate synthase